MLTKSSNIGEKGEIFMVKQITSEGPNSDEIDFWNGPQGKNWVVENRLTDLMYEPFGDKTIERAELTPGERILDIGCGCGTTTLKLARLLAPDGDITALDISTLMLSIASERTKSAAVPVKIINADAESYKLVPGTFDVMFSQFGLMFFRNPQKAFDNFHASLKPGGRIAFVCWRDPERNPWLVTPFEAVHHFKPEMETPNPDARASPFSFSSQKKVEALLRDTGFVDVQLEPFETKARMGEGSLEECTRFVIAFAGGTVGAVLRGSGEENTPAIIAALQTGLAPYHIGNRIKLGASAWIVSARRP